MKTSLKNVSPFIILLIPALLIVAILAVNPLSPEEAEQVKAISSFNLPDMKSLVQVFFAIR